MRSTRFAVAYVLPAAMVIALVGRGAWTFFPIAFVFLLTPVLDVLLGLEKRDEDEASSQWGYDFWLYAWAPVHLGLLVLTMLEVLSPDRVFFEQVGLSLSMGLYAGAGGINVAHELMHRKGKLPRAIAEVLMTSVSYPHFIVEHVLGHHRNVATPLDPASARLGESIVSFLPRTLAGSFGSAIHLEAERLQIHGLPAWTLADRRLRYPLILAASYLAIGLVFGPRAVVFFGVQSVVAIFLLETINFVEHYGLSRKLLANGRYERVQPRHSWSSAHRLTGLYLFNLPRHADHHYLASRPYPLLRHFEESPQLPAGYATMLMVALVPPLWSRIMDPKVAAWNARAGAASASDEPVLSAHLDPG